MYHTFAERLGIDVLQASKKSAAIIVDHEVCLLSISFEFVQYLVNCSQNESTYTLNEPITSDSLVDFVYNFTTNNLTRHLKTTAISQSKQPLSFENSVPEKSSIKRRSSRTIRLRDIDSAGFNDHVLLSNKVSIFELSTFCSDNSTSDPNLAFPEVFAHIFVAYKLWIEIDCRL